MVTFSDLTLNVQESSIVVENIQVEKHQFYLQQVTTWKIAVTRPF